MSNSTESNSPPLGKPQTPGLDREEPELRNEDDIPMTQRQPAAEGAFDTDTVAPEDQSDG